MGNSSKWQTIIGDKIDFDDRDNPMHQVQNCYYGRDRGEKDQGYRVYKDEADYIKNVAIYFMDNPKVISTLDQKSDQEIIDLISSIKGVGVWTVQMFLMFTLNRPDIFPVTDLALQKGYSAYYNKKSLVDPKIMLNHSKEWIPHRTTMSLYLWRYLEGPFER